MQVKFIAEVSSNHNGDINRCLRFIKTASSIGCQGVKFQLFKINKLFAPEILRKSKKHRDRQAWELPIKFLPVLAKECHRFKLQFICTPFYLEAVKELKPYIDYYKIASYDLLRQDLLKACAKIGLPVIMSTGMANIQEIDKAMEVLRKNGVRDITLLHCLSIYPVLPKQCNLAVIKTIRERYLCPVGWSDHSVEANVIYRAVYHWKAAMIEFHLDLDKKGKEFKIGHCWLPEKIAPIIANIRKSIKMKKDYLLADGDGIKRAIGNEITERDWRADPKDGLRPRLKIREVWKKEKK